MPDPHPKNCSKYVNSQRLNFRLPNCCPTCSWFFKMSLYKIAMFAFFVATFISFKQSFQNSSRSRRPIEDIRKSTNSSGFVNVQDFSVRVSGVPGSLHKLPARHAGSHLREPPREEKCPLPLQLAPGPLPHAPVEPLCRCTASANPSTR